MRKALAAGLSAAAVIGATLSPAAASAATHASATPTPLGTPAPTATSSGSSQAGSDPDTTITFAVTSGLLTMTAPATADLGSGAPGTTITGAVGTTAVTDNRALLHATWTATASSTDFTTGTGTGNETIAATDARYTPGTVTTTGTITATPLTITLSHTAQPIVDGTAGVGDNSASWDPTIAVAVPAQAVVGTYTGTLTQSVS
jgi:hypothetical protein